MYIGAGYDLSGHLFSIFWPDATIQYRCDTSRDLIWCHVFGPMAPLRHKISKLCILTSLGPWSSFQSMQDLCRYILFGLVYSISWPLMTIQCRCYTWHGVIWCHDIGSTASSRCQTLALASIDHLSPTSVNGSGGHGVGMFEYTLWEEGNSQKYEVEGPQHRPRTTHWGQCLGPQIKCSYLGFPSSVLGNPKLLGPGCGLCGPLYSIFWPFVTIQYQCDISRDIIWCHDFCPTAPLRRQHLKLCTLTSLGSWSSFKGTTDLDIHTLYR